METQQVVTVRDILDRYEVECLPKLAERTRGDYVRHLVTLRREFGDRIAEELKPKDFGPFLNVQKGQIQRVRQLAVLSAAFTQAVSFWYLIPSNVLRDVKRPKSEPRDRLVEMREFESCLAIAPKRVKLMMRLALKIGQRQGDLLSLKWSDVKDMEVHLRQSKTGKRLAIGIDKELETILDECWKLPRGGCDGGEYLITRRCGGRYTSTGFRALWQRTIRQYVKRGGTRFQFRDLRAMCATRCPSPEYARQLLGHTNISMTMKVYRRGIERVQCLPGVS